jgi:D-xylose transport system substrate-binding protein
MLALLVLVPLAQPQSSKQLAAVLGSWEGESKCMVADPPCQDEHVLYQVSTDNNATLFAQGYNSVLSTQAGWTKLDDGNGNWSATTATSVFQNQLGKYGSKINAVMVANDTMAQSVINVLQQQGLAGKVAVSGQDATPGGLDNIMAGSQCFTIYKPVAGEADVAIKLASEILAGQKPTAPASVTDPSNGKSVPAYLATPTVITQANVALPVKDGYETAASVCGTSATAQANCTKFGIS